MSVNLSQIISACARPDAKRDYINSVKTECRVNSYKCFFRYEDIVDMDCIYIGRASDLPQILPDLPRINIIVVKDAKLPQQYLDSVRVNIVQLPGSTDLIKLVDMVHGFFVSNEYVCDCVEELLDKACNAKNYKEVAEVASRIFDNPIAITDLSLNIIAACGGDEARKDIIWRQAIQNGYFQESYFDAVLEREQHFDITDKKDFFIWETPFLSYREAVGKIRLKADILGYVKILEVNRKVTKNDMQVLKSFANILAILFKTNHIKEVISNPHTELFFKSLISGSLTDPAIILNRLKHLDISLKPNLYVICVDADSSGTYDRKQDLYMYSYIFQKTFNREFFIIHNKLLVIVADTLKNEEDFRLMLNGYTEVSGKNDLIIGCSNCFHDIAALKEHFEQAYRAIGTAQRSNLKGNIFYYDEIIIYDMLDIFAKHDYLENLLHPSLMAIKDYDMTNRAELLQTLEEYLANQCDISKTAKALHLHYNTVKYRIGKITEIMPISFDDNKELLRLQLSFMALKRLARGA